MAEQDYLDILSQRFESGRISRRRFIQLLAVAAGAIPLAACGPTTATPQATTAPGAVTNPQSTAAPAAPKKGGTLKYGLSTDPPNMDPHISTGAAASTVKAMMLQGLMTVWRGGKIVPELAESYTMEGNNYVFKLRQGVKFHNGEEFTSDDVKWNIDRIKDPKVGAYFAGTMADVGTVEMPDKYTARFVMKKPNATLLAVLANMACLMTSKKHGSDPTVDLKTQPVGTGPFKWVERQPGVSVKLTRNENYWQPGLPYLDAITYIPYPDDTARVTALRTGAVDLIDYVPFKDIATIQGDNKLFTTSDSVSGYGWMAYVVDKPPFDNVKVRQGLAYALDRQAIMESAFSGRGKPMTGGLIPETFDGYNNLEGRYTFQPDKAKQLLTEAGYKNLGDLKFQMLSTSTYTVIGKPAEAAQGQLKQFGVGAELVMQEWLTFRATVTAGTYPVHVWGSAPDINDPDFLSQQLQTGKVLAPQIHFSDAQLDALFDKARGETNQDTRKALYKQIEERTLDLCPWTYLVRREQAEAGAAYVKGYEHIPAAWTAVTLRETWLDKTAS
jgi:peptide/nickel transport system substrate-binding protein